MRLAFVLLRFMLDKMGTSPACALAWLEDLSQWGPAVPQVSCVTILEPFCSDLLIKNSATLMLKHIRQSH